ncbi:MAG: zf-HC2 domain-containing protein [candidate division WOR-3 bacterium]|nr:MAG: zf-HC2 domain-containing protein [candidate division WOR-3 bacterium]
MNCNELKSLVQEYVTRELTPEDRHRVDTHVMDCQDCRRELALMSAVVSGLDSQPASEPPAGFAARVMAGLPRQRELVLSPWWSLAAAPVLGVLAYLFRAPLLESVLRLAGRTGIGQVSVTELGLAQMAIVPAVVVLLALGVTAAAATYCWRSC